MIEPLKDDAQMWRYLFLFIDINIAHNIQMTKKTKKYNVT